MYDEDFVKSCIPIIESLANTYKNDYHDYDELFSEGQYRLITYLNNRTSVTKGNVWNNLTYHLRRFANTRDDNIDYSIHIDDIICKPKNSQINLLNDALDSLTEREQDIVNKFYGITTNKYTLEQLAKEYKVNKERIRQIVKRSMEKMKEYLIKHNYVNQKYMKKRGI